MMFCVFLFVRISLNHDFSVLKLFSQLSKRSMAKIIKHINTNTFMFCCFVVVFLLFFLFFFDVFFEFHLN